MKRATVINLAVGEEVSISIHALVKRATLLDVSTFLLMAYFNPRPREEGDVRECLRRLCDTQISIHALVKRATKRKVQV